MIDLENKNICPDLTEIGDYVRNPVFMQFCAEVKNRYQCNEKIEFSSCSLAKGWNVKFKKAGRALCTIYPHELYFTVMLVVGRKEKEPVEMILSELTPELQAIYNRTQENNGQKWLMIDLEDQDDMFNDVFRLMQIRRKY